MVAAAWAASVAGGRRGLVHGAAQRMGCMDLDAWALPAHLPTAPGSSGERRMCDTFRESMVGLGAPREFGRPSTVDPPVPCGMNVASLVLGSRLGELDESGASGTHEAWGLRLVGAPLVAVGESGPQTLVRVCGGVR